jgi:hypothetical protein
MQFLSLKVMVVLIIGQVWAKPAPFVELGKLTGGVTSAFGKMADTVTGSLDHLKNKIHHRTTTLTTRVPVRKLESPVTASAATTALPINPPTVAWAVTTPLPTKANLQLTTQKVITTPVIPAQRPTTPRPSASNDRIVFEDDPVAFGSAANPPTIETTTSFLDDRHVFNSPVNCPKGQKLQGNACRTISI